MARTQNPILGRARGSIGNAVLTKQYKHNTARSKPLSVKNPNTEKQQLVRGKMSLIGHLIMIAGNAMRSYLPKSLSDMPVSSWFIKSLSLATTYDNSAKKLAFDMNALFGGNTAFFGSGLTAAIDQNDVDAEFNISNVNPWTPQTGDKVNFVVFDDEGKVKGMGEAQLTVSTSKASFTFIGETSDTYEKGNVLVISPQNWIDSNGNQVSKTFKITNSSRLGNFLLATKLTTNL